MLPAGGVTVLSQWSGSWSVYYVGGQPPRSYLTAIADVLNPIRTKYIKIRKTKVEKRDIREAGVLPTQRQWNHQASEVEGKKTLKP